ncbi:MAG: GNAT family N-acetyltransferase [Phycisphaeraceae bacterium]|nr:GNAT family N-acetyltransferase [Phycisphaeraceae bacterium]
MPLTLESYDARYLDGMTALYNRAAAGNAHIVPLTPGLFVELVCRKSYFDPATLLVAVDGGEVVGWVHWTVTGPTEHWYNRSRRYARISMVMVDPGRLDAGVVLVEQATAALRAQGHERLLGMHCDGGYPFYRGLFDGGEPMAPVEFIASHMALGYHGYKTAGESVFKVARMTQKPAVVEARIAMEYRDVPLAELPGQSELGNESWVGFEPRVIRAFAEGQDVGAIGYVMQPQLAARLGHPAANIFMLGVTPTFQRKGIAASLVSRMLIASWERGAREASVGSDIYNPAPHQTYAKLGFEPQGLSIGRVLSVPADQ